MKRRIQSPEAHELIERVRKVDRASPVIDTARIEEAVARHFKALGMLPRDVRWMGDAAAGAWAAGGTGWSEEWSDHEADLWCDAELAAWSELGGDDEIRAWQDAWNRGQSVIERAAWDAALDVTWDVTDQLVKLVCLPEARRREWEDAEREVLRSFAMPIRLGERR